MATNVIVPSTVKNCGTCQYWAGSREPDAFMKRVSFDAGIKSKCMGKFKPAALLPSHTCDGYVMWGVLKK